MRTFEELIELAKFPLERDPDNVLVLPEFLDWLHFDKKSGSFNAFSRRGMIFEDEIHDLLKAMNALRTQHLFQGFDSVRGSVSECTVVKNMFQKINPVRIGGVTSNMADGYVLGIFELTEGKGIAVNCREFNGVMYQMTSASRVPISFYAAQLIAAEDTDSVTQQFEYSTCDKAMDKAREARIELMALLLYVHLVNDLNLEYLQKAA